MKNILSILGAVLITATFWAQSPEKMSYQAVIRDASQNIIVNQSVGMQISVLQGGASGFPVYVETQTPTTNTNGLITLEIGAGNVSLGTFSEIGWLEGPYFIKTETDPEGGSNYTITGVSQLLSVPFALHAKTAETVENLVIAGDEEVFANWDKNTDDDFSGDYNDLENLPVIITTEQTEAIDANTLKITNVQADWTATEGNSQIVNKPINIDDDKLDDVTLTGDQTIEGTKTFTGVVTVPTPVNNTDAATKAYVDALETRLNVLEIKFELSEGAVVSDLVDDGASVSDLLAAGISVSDLLATGTSVSDLLDANVSVSDLLDAGKTIDDFIGIYYKGGIIFYVNESDGTGLVCAINDLEGRYPFGPDIVTGATDKTVGAGKTNTATIISVYGDGVYAAKAVEDLVFNGYDDWFVPSLDEGRLLNTNRLKIDETAIAKGGISFLDEFYETSTEYPSTDNTGRFHFVYGKDNTYGYTFKSISRPVRVIRAF